jgi:hypothetical protein
MTDKIIENHNVNTRNHKMKTQGWYLKEIKKNILFDKDNSDKKEIIIHVWTIEQSQSEPYNLRVLSSFPKLDFLWSRSSV